MVKKRKLKKVSKRNRLSVFKSNNHMYAQLIDDKKGVTLASASSIEKNIEKKETKRRIDIKNKTNLLLIIKFSSMFIVI